MLVDRTHQNQMQTLGLTRRVEGDTDCLLQEVGPVDEQ